MGKRSGKSGPDPLHGEAMDGATRQAALRKRKADTEYRVAVTLLRLSLAAPQVDVPDDVGEWAQRLVDKQKAAWKAEAIARSGAPGGPLAEAAERYHARRAARSNG